METIKEIPEVIQLFWIALGWYILIPPALIVACLVGTYLLERKAKVYRLKK